LGGQHQSDARHRGPQGQAGGRARHWAQISQAPYDHWRDQGRAHAPKAFEVHEQSQREARLALENARLQMLVGERPLELKKSDEVLG
jgi:hypothetical protein